MRVFFRFKNGPFSLKAKKHNLMRLKTERFHHRFFGTPVWHADLDHSELQNDRLEVANRSSNITYCVITWYLIGFVCNTIIQSSINTSHSSSTHDKDPRTTTCPRHTSSAAACTDWSGRVQAHTRPALSQELSVRHRGGTMVDVWAIIRSCRRSPRTAAAVSLSLILPDY